MPLVFGNTIRTMMFGSEPEAQPSKRIKEGDGVEGERLAQEARLVSLSTK